MKKLFYVLFVLVGFATSTIAQESVATTKGKTELVKSKQEGNYEITLPSSVTAEDVAKNSKYYVYYFTVNFDDASKVAKIAMVENDSRNRSIIMRFLSALNVDGVMVDGNKLSLEEFKNNFLL